MKLFCKLLLTLTATLLLSACNPKPLQLTDLQGNELNTENNWLILNYWATWCKPCRVEVPELNLLQQELRGQQILLIGINYDGLEASELIRASQELGIEFAVAQQNPAKHFGLPSDHGLPVTYIINPQGKVERRLLGEQNKSAIIEQLQTLGALSN